MSENEHLNKAKTLIINTKVLGTPIELIITTTITTTTKAHTKVMKSLQIIPVLLLLAVSAISAPITTSTASVVAPVTQNGPTAPATTDAILNDLVELGIIKNKSKASFLLEKGRLIVNDEWQDKDTLAYFVKKYNINKSDTWIVYNYSM